MMKKITFLCILLSLSASAQAHVSFEAKTAAAAKYHVAKLRIFHGCDGSPTIKVTVDIPEEVTSVKPRALPGWAVSTAMEALDKPKVLHGEEIAERVASITWEGGILPDFAYQQFEMHMMMPHHAHEGALSFPVHQVCESGRLEWVEKALDQETFGELLHPAPFITLE